MNPFNLFEACCVANHLALPPVGVIDSLHRLQREPILCLRPQLPRIQEPLAHRPYGTVSSRAWSALSVLTLTVAASARPTRSSSTKADTSVPATTVIPPPAAGIIVHGRITNITSYPQANMPTSCSIIRPPPYTNVGDNGAMSSDSSSQDLLPRVSDLLV